MIHLSVSVSLKVSFILWMEVESDETLLSERRLVKCLLLV